jgi:hypothetical protein
VIERIRIERLVVDEGVLAPGDLPGFEAAISRELEALRRGRDDRRRPLSDRLESLARDTAAGIHVRMPVHETARAPLSPVSGKARI